MTSPTQPGFRVDDSPLAANDIGRPRIEPWRIAASAAIVVVVVAAIWLWGRPHREPAGVVVAVTAEAWLAGQPTGALEAVTVPADLAAQFADPNVISSSVVAFDVPPGTFVTPALLGPPDEGLETQTVIRLSADTSAWPEPGPRAGSRAVVAGVLGGCALDVTTLAGGAEGAIVVRVDAADAARYARAADIDGLVVWPAPQEGWPPCRTSPTTAESGFGFSGSTPSEFGNAGPPASSSDRSGATSFADWPGG